MDIENKKSILRDNIIKAAHIYSYKMAGKHYLYIFEGHCFEMYYGIENFLHLVGVDTRLSPIDFYRNAQRGILNTGQFGFSARHPLATAWKKSKALLKLESFLHEGYFIIKDVETETAFYPYAITDIDRSLLLGLDRDKKVKDTEIYIPQSLRIKGNIFNKSEDNKIFEINSIFSKTDYEAPYSLILYKDRMDFNALDSAVKIELIEIYLAIYAVPKVEISAT